jgi:predicted transcriptional regulator
MKQNITLKLDRDVLRKAKVIAARRDKSISQLLADQVAEIVHQDEAYEQAMRAALATLDTGFHLGGKGVADRDALHER